jgi:hypothetical protein
VRAAHLTAAIGSPPFLDVPPPHRMVIVPALDLAAATSALGNALLIASIAIAAMAELPIDRSKANSQTGREGQVT